MPQPLTPLVLPESGDPEPVLAKAGERAHHSGSLDPRFRGCQEVLRMDNSSSPRKLGPRACPWHEQGGKQLKSLGSRFRGNDEQRGAKIGCAELDYSLFRGGDEQNLAE
jgi:hypothetical protein